MIKRSFPIAAICAVLASPLVAQDIDGPTGVMFLEAKVSQNHGAVYRLGVSESNLLGQNIGAELSFAKTDDGDEKRLLLEKRFDLARGTMSVSGSFLDRSYGDENFDLLRKGLRVRYDMPVSDAATLRVGVFGRMDDVSNIRAGTSPIIAADAGDRRTLGAELGFAFDTRDNALLPASGVRAEIGASIASVDGDPGWQAIYADAEAYVPLGAVAVAKLSLAAGRIEGRDGRSVPVTERAFPGTDTPRGFVASTFGPHDGADTLGGKSYVYGSLEAFAPILKSRSQRLFAGAFVDAGSLWDLDDTAGASGVVDDSYFLRSSAGLSLSYLTEFGRIEASAAKPLRSRAGDETQTLQLQLETRF